MARPAYRVTLDDFQHAYDYLASQIRLGEILPDDESAEDELLRLAGRPSHKRAADLQAWCDRHLNPDERRRTAAAIRKRRLRWANGSGATIHVSEAVRALLARLAKREGCTYGELLDRLLRRELGKRR